MSWLTKPLAGLLIDITGVLYESGAEGGSAIHGSPAAIERLVSDYAFINTIIHTTGYEGLDIL